MVDKDANVYNGVVKAFKLPKHSDEEKKIREQAIQNALKKAADVPLECTNICHKVMQNAKTVAEKGNVNAITDSGVAAAMANSGIFGAALNVKINLFSIKDEEFKKKKEEELKDILSKSKHTINEIFKSSL